MTNHNLILTLLLNKLTTSPTYLSIASRTHCMTIIILLKFICQDDTQVLLLMDISTHISCMIQSSIISMPRILDQERHLNYYVALKNAIMIWKGIGFIARLGKLENEISKTIVQLFEDQNLDYQLVAPGDHRLLSAKRTIQTFNNYFIAVCSGMNFNSPKRAWHHALYQTVITLSVLLPSLFNPKISAYM